MSKKFSKEDFISKSKLTHTIQYDYTDTIFLNTRDFVIIKCPTHGRFKQNASSHLRGTDCPKCSKNKQKITLEEFINRGNRIHNGKYDYKKSIFVDYITKLIIICPIHGEFSQKPHIHLIGAGCLKCANENSKIKKKFNFEEFITEANKVHNNKYIYKNSFFKKTTRKISIICKIHGDFEQGVSNHLSGIGCNKCSGFYKNVDDLKNEFNIIHNNKYDYSKFLILNKWRNKINIICPVHGEFSQSIREHLRGSECQLCAKEKGSMMRTLDVESFINRSNMIHNFKYNYSDVSFSNLNEKVRIICPEHGAFEQKANHHLNGSDCADCAVMSNGENQIKKLLMDNNIEHISQKRFTKCRNVKMLPFDFYLPKRNICIEYNGGQHYAPINVFGGINNFLKLQQNDTLKIDYCNKNNINLIIIALSKHVTKEKKLFYNSKEIKVILIDKIKKNGFEIEKTELLNLIK